MNRAATLKSVMLTVVVVLATATASAPVALGESATPEFAAQMLAREAEWLAAYDNNDVEAMDRIVAPDFFITYPNGSILDKADTMAMLSPGKAANPEWNQYTEESTVRVWGDTAVISGIYVSDGPQRKARSRYTDTWIRLDGRWQVVASQLSRLDEEEKP